MELLRFLGQNIGKGGLAIICYSIVQNQHIRKMVKKFIGLQEKLAGKAREIFQVFTGIRFSRDHAPWFEGVDHLRKQVPLKVIGANNDIISLGGAVDRFRDQRLLFR